jgi:hypothetical protein
MAPLTCSDSQTQRYSFRECQRADKLREEGGRGEEGVGVEACAANHRLHGDPVPFTPLFICEENFEFTGCGIVQNTEA